MRSLGFALMLIGFFGASFISVRHADSEGLAWQTIEWGWYAAAFFVGVTGVAMLRATAKSAGTQAHKLDADLETMDVSLSSLVTKLEAINNGREGIGVYGVRHSIDDELAGELGTFVDARESLIHLYGLQPYADLMSEFAAGERNINRAWAASADGYIDEVWTCLDRAVARMSAAQSLLQQYQTTNA